MAKAGKFLLLIALFLATGVTVNSNAQESLIPQPLKEVQKTPLCSPIEDYLLTLRNSCDDNFFVQIDKAQKTKAKKIEEESKVFSYQLEPVYFIPETIPPEIPAPTTPPVTETPPQQVPLDMIPSNSANLDSNMIFDMINAHRTQIGKAPFQKDDALCSLAQTRSLELHNELFVNGNLHSGLYNRNLPYWITENAKWGSNEAGTVQWWLNSPIHRSAIQGDYTYSCGACNGSQCAQLFTSYAPKGVSSTPKGGVAAVISSPTPTGQASLTPPLAETAQ